MRRERASDSGHPAMAQASQAVPTPRLAVPIKNTFVHFDGAGPWSPFPLCRLSTWPQGSERACGADISTGEGSDSDDCSWDGGHSSRSATPPPACTEAELPAQRSGSPKDTTGSFTSPAHLPAGAGAELPVGELFRALHLEPVGWRALPVPRRSPVAASRPTPQSAPSPHTKSLPPEEPEAEAEPDAEESTASDATPSGSSPSEEAWSVVQRRAPRQKRQVAEATKLVDLRCPGRAASLSAFFVVGMEDDAAFRVVARILGPGGRRIQHLAAEAGEGVRVWLCGRGTTHRGSAAEHREASGPLTVRVRATTRCGLERAAALVQELLADVEMSRRECCQASELKAEAPAAWAISRWPQATGDEDLGHPVPAPRGQSEARGCRGEVSADQRLSCRIRVGIEEDPSFRVVAKLLGVGGENMRYIASEARGARVSLRGAGMRRGGASELESAEPLAIWVSASTQQGFERAACLAEDLLADVQADYRAFCRESNLPGPVLEARRELQEGTHAGEMGEPPLGPKKCALQAAAATGSQGPSNAETLPGGPALWERAGVLSCHIQVGIEDDADFCVVRRLLGRGGRNTRYIASEAGVGTKVWIHGRGSQRGKQSSDPLAIGVSAASHQSLEQAKRLVEELLADVHQDHGDFSRRRRQLPGAARVCR